MIRKLMVMILCLWSGSVLGGLPFAPSADEIRVLPPYCAAKLNNNPSDDQQYAGMIGPDWLHIHHYCFALNFTNRYYRLFTDKNEQRAALNAALGEYNYMFSHATPNFGLRPEMLTQKGKLLIAAKRNAEALGELQKAIQLSPTYTQAHILLSDLYQKLNQKAEALAVVEQGLLHTPEKTALQNRYKELTGKSFVPPPRTHEEETQKSHSAPAEPAVSPSSDAEIETEAVPPPAETPPAPKNKIGTPTNPYCRFCP